MQPGGDMAQLYCPDEVGRHTNTRLDQMLEASGGSIDPADLVAAVEAAAASGDLAAKISALEVMVAINGHREGLDSPRTRRSLCMLATDYLEAENDRFAATAAKLALPDDLLSDDDDETLPQLLRVQAKAAIRAFRTGQFDDALDLYLDAQTAYVSLADRRDFDDEELSRAAAHLVITCREHVLDRWQERTLGLLHLSRTACRAGDFQQGVAHAAEALEIMPSERDPEAWTPRALTLRSLVDGLARERLPTSLTVPEVCDRAEAALRERDDLADAERSRLEALVAVQREVLKHKPAAIIHRGDGMRSVIHSDDDLPPDIADLRDRIMADAQALREDVAPVRDDALQDAWSRLGAAEQTAKLTAALERALGSSDLRGLMMVGLEHRGGPTDLDAVAPQLQRRFNAMIMAKHLNPQPLIAGALVAELGLGVGSEPLTPRPSRRAVGGPRRLWIAAAAAAILVIGLWLLSAFAG